MELCKNVWSIARKSNLILWFKLRYFCVHILFLFTDHSSALIVCDIYTFQILINSFIFTYIYKHIKYIYLKIHIKIIYVVHLRLLYILCTFVIDKYRQTFSRQKSIQSEEKYRQTSRRANTTAGAGASAGVYKKLHTRMCADVGDGKNFLHPAVYVNHVPHSRVQPPHTTTRHLFMNG